MCFLPNLCVSSSPYFDHDAFLYHAIQVGLLDAPANANDLGLTEFVQCFAYRFASMIRPLWVLIL